VSRSKRDRRVVVLRFLNLPWATLRKGDIFRIVPADRADTKAPKGWYQATDQRRGPRGKVKIKRVRSVLLPGEKAKVQS
jgi:hypothetical protein